jgi:hypothetical protein
VNFKPKELYEALRQNRRRENAEEFKEEYRNRAGIEGTISQGVRAFGLRRSRYMGISKTRLMVHTFIANRNYIDTYHQCSFGGPACVGEKNVNGLMNSPNPPRAVVMVDRTGCHYK